MTYQSTEQFDEDRLDVPCVILGSVEQNTYSYSEDRNSTQINNRNNRMKYK